ncbi:MAG: RDD family protein [Rhodanobacteraceae bacterium]
MIAAAPLHWLPSHAQYPGLHAGFWRRALAYLIDGLILSPLFVVLYLRVAGMAAVPALVQPGGMVPFRWLPSLWLPCFVIAWLYFALCEASAWQATPGKLALGLKVTDECGRRIGFGRASGRYFGKLLSGLILDIGYMLAGWTARKQALHDLMAGCCVVRRAGLDAWQREQASASEPAGIAGSASAASPQTGMPGWAVALIVMVVCVFVVLPVAGVLAAFAIPVYQGYAVRTEVEQGAELTQRARSLIAEYIGERGALPDNNAALGLPKPEAIHARYVTSVRVVGGKVVVTYGNQASAWIRGGHLVISPVGNVAQLHWKCSSPDIRDWYLPVACRE